MLTDCLVASVVWFVFTNVVYLLHKLNVSEKAKSQPYN